jgi:pyruvate formate lyase activating enzyme
MEAQMNHSREITGRIFNIQGYSIHDGPGIRTAVFLCGCPLRCWWCHNPESATKEPKLFFMAEKCVGCGACIPKCSRNAISVKDGKASTDRSLCIGCGNCVSVCPNDAREISGEEKSAGEIADLVCRDKIFYDSSGGGVTLSGGEVLFQPDFSAAILALCKEQGVQTAIETCGFSSWDNFSKILEYTDLVLYDFKNMDSAMHKSGTGVGNELILENAVRVFKEARKKMIARVPVIPGFNDTKENMEALGEFITQKLDQSVKVHLLPYHNLGESKNDRLEKTEGRIQVNPPADEHMENLRNIIAGYGLEAVIGG